MLLYNNIDNMLQIQLIYVTIKLVNNNERYYMSEEVKMSLLDEIKKDKVRDNPSVEVLNFKSLDEIENFFQGRPRTYSNLSRINIEFDCNKTDYQKIQEFLSKFQGQPIDVSFSVKGLRVADAENIVELEEFIQKNNNGKVFIASDFDYKEYVLSETLSAQQKANEIVKNLKDSDLSPFEKYMAIYNFLTTKVYHESDDDLSKSRNLISVLNGDDIVCVGYAKLMKYLCDEVGIPCICQESEVYNRTDGRPIGGHENNIVCIDDDKYNIHGIFYSDACWDSSTIVNGREQKRTLNHCLIPLTDKNKLNADVKTRPQFNHFYSNHFSDNEYLNTVIDSRMLMYYPETKSFTLKTIGKDENYIKEVEKKATDIVNDDQRVANACDLLEKLFNENGIKDNVYECNPPKSLHFETMLALCMSKNPDMDLINENIQRLKQTDKKYRANKSIISKIADKWNTLTGKSKEFKFSETIKGDLVLYRENNELTKVQLIDSICQVKLSMDIANDLRPKIDSQPISINSYNRAMNEVCKHEGMSEAETKAEVKGYFDRTEATILNSYTEGATNKLYTKTKEIYERRKNQQSQQNNNDGEIEK